MGKFADLLKKARGSEAAPSGDSPDTDSPDLTSVRSTLRGSRSRASKLEQEARESDLQRELDKLYTPENWKRISSLYFDARYVQTGDDLFQLDDGERTTLGTSLAASARLLLKIDPGYIALIIFTANLGQMIAMKETQYAKKRKAHRPIPQPARPSDGQTVRS